jgi:hypothetical protein
MDSRDKTIKLLETFLSDKEVDGVCGYIVDPDGEGQIQVIVVLDIDYIKEANTKPGFVAKMIREGVKQEIKKWIGLDVYVGSTAKKCDESESLSESLSESVVYDYIEGRNKTPERLPFDVNKLINAGAVFITPAIEGDSSSKNYKKFLKRPYTHLITLHNLKHSSPDSWIHKAVTRSASPKHWEGKEFTKNLYDGKYNQILWSLDELGVPYESMLIDEVNESKKKYIVSESQYNIILESQKYIKVFQEMVDKQMTYIRSVCDMGSDDYEGDVGDESCRQIENLEKVIVTDADWVTVMHSNQPLEQKYMSVKLMVYYSSIRRGDFDADDLTYDLEKIIRKKTSMPVIINYESTNTNTSFEW